MPRFLTVAGLVAAATMSFAPAASAHVSVQPGTAEQGSFAKIALRVPNERDDASTTMLRVQLPSSTPISFVSVRPVPGWTVKVDRARLPQPVTTEGGDQITEAVSVITWSGGRIDPGQFQEFEISAGPLPEVDQIVLPAVQTYDSGEVVRWIEEPNADGSEPEHPAPVLKLTAAAEEPRTAPAGDGSSAAGSGGTAETAGDDSGSAGLDRALAIAGVVAGLAGVTFGLLAWRRRPGPA